jgi:tetratricopeptide (TPR) repeat protein
VKVVMSRSTGIGALCCVLVLLIASGCETTGGTKGPTGDLMSRAVADYEAGRYETASGGAEEVMRSASGPQLENAAYLAGLSAYRLGRSDQAERRLMTAAGSNRPETAGKAKAMLGIIRLDQNRPREAIDLFEAAAGMLTGSDAERAREHAQLARSRAGEPDSPGIHHYASAAGAGQFALQVGAFRDADGAGRAAREAQTIADRAGLGPVRIVPGTDEQGGRLYLVQFGRFASRGAAATARAEIGTLEYIVAPLAGMTALR